MDPNKDVLAQHITNIVSKLNSVKNIIANNQIYLAFAKNRLKQIIIKELDNDQFYQMYVSTLKKIDKTSPLNDSSLHEFFGGKSSYPSHTTYHFNTSGIRLLYSCYPGSVTDAGRYGNVTISQKSIDDINGEQKIPIEYYIRVYFFVKESVLNSISQYEKTIATFCDKKNKLHEIIDKFQNISSNGEIQNILDSLSNEELNLI